MHPSPEGFEDAQSNLDRLLEDPLWQQLEGVQNDEVYLGGPYWIGSGIYAANRVIDDLFLFVAGVDPAEVSPNPLLPDIEMEMDATEEASD